MLRFSATKPLGAMPKVVARASIKHCTMLSKRAGQPNFFLVLSILNFLVLSILNYLILPILNYLVLSLLNYLVLSIINYLVLPILKCAET